MKNKVASIFLVSLLIFSLLTGFTSIGIDTYIDTGDAHEDINIFVFADDLLADEYFMASVDKLLVDTFGYEVVENVKRANYYGDIILESFPRNRLGEIIFPEFFGGEYINCDGYLVFNIVNAIMTLDEASTMVTNLLGYNHSVILQPTSFSHNEIINANDMIHYTLFVNSQISEPIGRVLKNFNGSRICFDLGGIVVYMRSLNEKEVSLFRYYVFDSPMLSFYERYAIRDNLPAYTRERAYHEEITPFSITLNPGDRISLSSVGFRARTALGWNGFIITGHDPFMRMESVVWHNGQRIGTIQRHQESPITGVDAAFLQLETGNVTNMARNFGTLTAVTQPRQGDHVALLGSSTGTRVGSVVATSITCPAGWRNQILINYSLPTQGGDSGGVVFTTTHRHIIGIHAASLRNPDTGQTIGWAAINAVDILSRFGLTWF